MALATNSYGDTGEIASMQPRYANTDTPGIFDTTTRPTLLQVESFTNQVSAVVNGMLAKEGFTIPVTEDDTLLALDLFVNEEVASIVEGVNGSGKFGPSGKKGGGKGRWAVLFEDVVKYINKFASGWEALGATRSGASTLQGLGYMTADNQGNAVFPIRVRQEFGNTFEEWDPA